MAPGQRTGKVHPAERRVTGGRTLRDWVDEAVARLVPVTGAELVILFGSVARGDDSTESDIDLLVVVADDADVRQAGKAALRAVASLPADVDVVVVTRRTLEAGRNRPGTVIRPALRDGRVVYRRAA